MIIYIPIKHESQRVPEKNFRIFQGKPLYLHCIDKFSEDQFEVYIDTDSDDIMHEINSNSNVYKNVTVFRRDEHLLGHKTSVCDLIHNFILKYNITDPICQLHVTSPFLSKDVIVNAFSKIGKNYDSIVACNVLNTRLWRREEYGYCPVNHNPMKLEQTQDLPVLYEENSAFYIFNPDIVSKTKNRIGINPFFYNVSFPENIDIDTEDDWRFAKAINEYFMELL